MKTLKESLLGDLDANLAKGDEMKKIIENVFKQLSTYISKSSNWQKTGRGDYIKYYVGVGSFMNFETIVGEELRSLLQLLGFDCNHIYISLQPNQSPNNTFAPNSERPSSYNYWGLTIKFTNSTESIANDVMNGKVKPKDLTKNQFIKTVYISQDKAKLFTSVIKNYIKPAMKSIETFKKFIKDIENAKNDILIE